MPEVIPPNDSMEELLIREQGLIIIPPTDKFEMPPDANYSALADLGIGEEEARREVDHIVNFLNLPIIIDRFEKDHEARRTWRKEMLARYGENALNFLYKNKLRIVKFTHIDIFFTAVEISVRKKSVPTTPVLEKIRSLEERYREIMRNYKTLDVEGKIAAIRKLDDLAREILELFK